MTSPHHSHTTGEKVIAPPRRCAD